MRGTRFGFGTSATRAFDNTLVVGWITMGLNATSEKKLGKGTADRYVGVGIRTEPTHVNSGRKEDLKRQREELK